MSCHISKSTIARLDSTQHCTIRLDEIYRECQKQSTVDLSETCQRRSSTCLDLPCAISRREVEAVEFGLTDLSPFPTEIYRRMFVKIYICTILRSVCS